MIWRYLNVCYIRPDADDIIRYVVIWRYLNVCYISATDIIAEADVVIWRYLNVCYIEQGQLDESSMLWFDVIWTCVILLRLSARGRRLLWFDVIWTCVIFQKSEKAPPGTVVIWRYLNVCYICKRQMRSSRELWFDVIWTCVIFRVGGRVVS